MIGVRGMRLLSGMELTSGLLADLRANLVVEVTLQLAQVLCRIGRRDVRTG